MDLQKVNVKFLVADGPAVPLKAFIDVFNSWIQASPGEYYDLADYSHMDAGPGILLIADEANISIDESGNRRGLLLARKRPMDGSTSGKLRGLFKTALEYCRKLEEEPNLKGKLKFRGEEAFLIINDRLVAPNTEETFRVLKPELEELGRVLYGGVDFSLERDTEARRRFGVSLRARVPFEAGMVLENLEKTGTASRLPA